MIDTLEQQYSELCELWKAMTEAESKYYQLRYASWQLIASLKKKSPLKVSYKQYEGKCRRDAKKRIRSGEYGKRPRGKHLDHFYLPVIMAYILGIDDFDIVNSPLNCKWMNPKLNRKKGVCAADESYDGYDIEEYKKLQKIIKK